MKSLEGRNVDLVTISSHEDKVSEAFILKD